MRRIEGFQSAQSFTGGDGRSKLPAGAYVCKILDAKDLTDMSGSEYLLIAVDIAEGEYKDFFRKQFDSRKASNPDYKWPGTFRQYTTLKDGTASPWFKGFIDSVAESNRGFVWDWHEEDLKGKFVGIMFRDEEFMGNDGQVHISSRANFACPVSKVREGSIRIPAVKKLPVSSTASAGFVEVDPESELPF